MSDRMSDDEFLELSNIVNAFLPSRGLSLWCRLLMDRMDDEKELRDRRSRDLTSDEVEALSLCKQACVASDMPDSLVDRCVAVLERLVEGGK